MFTNFLHIPSPLNKHSKFTESKKNSLLGTCSHAENLVSCADFEDAYH